MNFREVIEKIKTKGYWRISFEPLAENEIPLTRCKELIEKNSVHLRGWDYPHVPQRLGEDTALEPGDNYWQGWLDWQGENHKEFWRLYQSGQYIHYLGLREDWVDLIRLRSMWHVGEQEFSSGQGLGVIGTTYQITEIYEFLSRLVQDGLYEGGVKVTISLHNTEGRQLIIEQFQRVGFSMAKKTSSATINFQKEYTKEEILIDSREKALEAIVHFFERFGWNPPNVEVIKSDQKNFLEGKI